MKDLAPVNVVDIDEGKLRKSIDDHLSMIAKDVVRRWGKTAARKVKVEITIAPSPNDDDVREAVITWKVDFMIPGKKGDTSKAAIENGLILVNPWDAQAPRQTIMPEVKETISEEEPLTAEETLAEAKETLAETEDRETNVAQFPVPPPTAERTI